MQFRLIKKRIWDWTIIFIALYGIVFGLLTSYFILLKILGHSPAFESVVQFMLSIIGAVYSCTNNP